MKASVLVCTGVDDPLAPREQVADFENEMRTGGVKDLAGHWLRQHAAWFHQPGRRWLGDAHRALLDQADRHSWASMKSLFDEVLT